MAPSQPAARPGLIQAVDRAVRLLLAIESSAQPATAPEVAKACGLNRSTAWRLLATLEHHGLVDLDRVSQRYSIGYLPARLAAVAGHSALARRARPALERLAADVDEYAHVSVPAQGSVVFVDQIQGTSLVSYNWIGIPTPLHATSVGKAYLARLSDEALDGFLAHPLESYTERTIIDPAGLRAELEKVRRRGYATGVQEWEEGLIGTSAPVIDQRSRPIAVVGVVGPVHRIPPKRLPVLGERCVQAAHEIEAALD